MDEKTRAGRARTSCTGHGPTLPAARRYLEEKGFSFDEESIKHFSDGRVLVIYAKEQIGGFAIHLMQK